MSAERPTNPAPTPKEMGEPSLVVRLTASPLLNQLVDYIAQTAIDWEMFEAYLRGRNLKADQIIAAGGVKGVLMELYLDMMIAHFAEGREDVILNPIPDGAKTTNFEFYRTDISKGGRFCVKEGHTGQTHSRADYDELLEVDGLPVIFEAKSSVRGTKKYRAATRKNPILREQHILRLAVPLAEYYKTTSYIYIGYAVFIMPEAISETSFTQTDFKDRGGILRSLPTTHKEFGKQANLLLKFL